VLHHELEHLSDFESQLILLLASICPDGFQCLASHDLRLLSLNSIQRRAMGRAKVNFSCQSINREQREHNEQVMDSNQKKKKVVLDNVKKFQLRMKD